MLFYSLTLSVLRFKWGNFSFAGRKFNFKLYKSHNLHKIAGLTHFFTSKRKLARSLAMLDDEVKDIDSIIDQGLNAENNELDLREKELDDEDLIKVMQSDKI